MNQVEEYDSDIEILEPSKLEDEWLKNEILLGTELLKCGKSIPSNWNKFKAFVEENTSLQPSIALIHSAWTKMCQIEAQNIKARQKLQENSSIEEKIPDSVKGQGNIIQNSLIDEKASRGTQIDEVFLQKESCMTKEIIDPFKKDNDLATPESQEPTIWINISNKISYDSQSEVSSLSESNFSFNNYTENCDTSFDKPIKKKKKRKHTELISVHIESNELNNSSTDISVIDEECEKKSMKKLKNINKNKITRHSKHKKYAYENTDSNEFVDCFEENPQPKNICGNNNLVSIDKSVPSISIANHVVKMNPDLGYEEPCSSSQLDGNGMSTRLNSFNKRYQCSPQKKIKHNYKLSKNNFYKNKKREYFQHYNHKKDDIQDTNRNGSLFACSTPKPKFHTTKNKRFAYKFKAEYSYNCQEEYIHPNSRKYTQKIKNNRSGNSVKNYKTNKIPKKEKPLVQDLEEVVLPNVIKELKGALSKIDTFISKVEIKNELQKIGNHLNNIESKCSKNSL